MCKKIGRISSGVSMMISFIWAETPTPSLSIKLEEITKKSLKTKRKEIQFKFCKWEKIKPLKQEIVKETKQNKRLDILLSYSRLFFSSLFFIVFTSAFCFQDDKDLVHEFVNNDGLDCLIKVGSEADQNYQNYILRGQYTHTRTHARTFI